jgi:hypothetical protein
MKQHSITPKRTTTSHRPLARAPVIMTGTQTLRRAGALLGAVAFSAALAVQPATAGVVEQGTFHDTYGPDPVCDGPFTNEGAADGRYRIVARGPDGAEYYSDHVTYNDTNTNTETGETVTVHGLYNGRDLKITNHPDGTITFVVQFTGTDVYYAEDGSVLGRTAGNFRHDATFDENGDLVSFHVLKETPNRGGGCAIIEQATG